MAQHSLAVYINFAPLIAQPISESVFLFGVLVNSQKTIYSKLAVLESLPRIQLVPQPYFLDFSATHFAFLQLVLFWLCRWPKRSSRALDLNSRSSKCQILDLRFNIILQLGLWCVADTSCVHIRTDVHQTFQLILVSKSLLVSLLADFMRDSSNCRSLVVPSA